MYALSELIQHCAGHDRQGRVRLLHALGYRNLNKGMRRLDAAIRGEAFSVHIVDQLASAAGLEQRVVDEAVARTRTELKLQAIRAFTPRLTPRYGGAKGPTPLASLVLTNPRYHRVALPRQIDTRSWMQQKAGVRQAIASFERWAMHQERRRLLDRYFGPIAGYHYEPDIESRYWVASSGEFTLTGERPELFCNPPCGLRLANGQGFYFT